MAEENGQKQPRKNGGSANEPTQTPLDRTDDEKQKSDQERQDAMQEGYDKDR